MVSEPASRDRSPGTASWLRPRIACVWAAIAIVVPVVATWLSRTQAIDLAYQVQAGRMMLETHHLLTADPFTFTIAGHGWLNQQWGAQILLAIVWRTGGWTAIAAVWGTLVGLASLFVYLSCRGAGASAAVAASLALVAYVIAAPVLTMRPQLIGIVLFTAVGWIVTTRDGSPRRLWLVPLLVIVWANVHGSFVLAFAILAIAWFEDHHSDRSRARKVLLIGVASLGATMVNPFGIRVWSYVISIAGNSTISSKVAEWGPPSVRTPIGALFFGSLLGAFVFVGTRSERASIVTYLALCFYAVLGIAAVRGIVWWALAFPVLVAPATRGLLERPAGRSAFNLVVLAGLASMVAVTYPSGLRQDPSNGGPAILTYAPEDLVAAARESVPPGGRVFASEVYASWVEFSAPDLPVFVDPRIELFPKTVWDDYFVVEDGRRGWEETLDRWNVDVLVLHPSWAAGLLGVIDRSSDWRLVANEPDGAVYVRA